MNSNMAKLYLKVLMGVKLVRIVGSLTSITLKIIKPYVLKVDSCENKRRSV